MRTSRWPRHPGGMPLADGILDAHDTPPEENATPRGRSWSFPLPRPRCINAP
jgi:hypothetical protein